MGVQKARKPSANHASSRLLLLIVIGITAGLLLNENQLNPDALLKFLNFS